MGKAVTYKEKEREITLFFPDRIMFENIESIRDDINEICSNSTHDKLIMDFAGVNYISSAGLRVFLELTKRQEKIQFINVSPEAYEVFEITGFTQLFPVERARRKITLEGAKLIGEGYFSKVYRLNHETVVKVYVRGTTLENIERELNLAKLAFMQGLPTAISFDVVEVDGMYGVVFELLDYGSLRDAVKEHPEDIDIYIEKYAELLMQINSIEDVNNVLPNAKQELFDALELIKNRISLDDYEIYKQLLATVPDTNTFLHGDCQIKNIMLLRDELMLIDLDTMAKGYFLMEIGNLYFTYTVFEELWPGNDEEFIGLTKEQVDCIRDGIIKIYLGKCTPEEFDRNLSRIRFMCYFHMLFWLTLNKKEDEDSFNKMYAHLNEYVKEVDTLVMEGIQ